MSRDHLREEYEQWAAQQSAAVTPQGAMVQPLPQPTQRRSRKGLIAILLIAFGSFLLLDELNFPIDNMLDSMWPFLAVAAGIWLIAGQRNRRLALGAIGMLTAVGLGFSVVYGVSDAPEFDSSVHTRAMYYDHSGLQNHEINIFDKNFEEATLTCHSEAIPFNLEGMDHDRLLFSSNGGLVNQGDYQSATSNIDFTVMPPFDADANVQLAENVPWDIDCSVVAADTHADFSDVNVSSLSLRSDGGNATIVLPEAMPNQPVSIVVTAGELELTSPKDTPVQFNITTSTGQIRVADELIGIGNGLFVSENWDEDKPFMEVNVTVDGGELILN